MNIHGTRSFSREEEETEIATRVRRRWQDRDALNAIARAHPERFQFVPGSDPADYLQTPVLRLVRQALERRTS